MERKADERDTMPLGLSFQLGMNQKALDAYARLDEQEKHRVLEAARNVRSKSEMHQIVERLEQGFC